MAILTNTSVTDTSGVVLPSGTSAQRPTDTVVSFTSTGAATFNVPVGVTEVEVLVVAGGGGGAPAHGTNAAGGGGAGGLVYKSQVSVTPGGSVPVTVGATATTASLV